MPQIEHPEALCHSPTWIANAHPGSIENPSGVEMNFIFALNGPRSVVVKISHVHRTRYTLYLTSYLLCITTYSGSKYSFPTGIKYAVFKISMFDSLIFLFIVSYDMCIFWDTWVCFSSRESSELIWATSLCSPNEFAHILNKPERWETEAWPLVSRPVSFFLETM